MNIREQRRGGISHITFSHEYPLQLNEITRPLSLPSHFPSRLLHLRFEYSLQWGEATQNQNKTKPQYGNMWFHTSCSLGLCYEERVPGNASGIPPTGHFRVRGFLHATLREIHW